MLPLITHSFAAEEISPGDTWKIFLNARDLDGDMKAIFCTVEQPGRGTYPVSLVNIAGSQRRELSGFLFLNTAGVQGMAFQNLTLTVQIQDGRGIFSQPIFFSVKFNPKAEQQGPPPGIFREEELGPIMVALQSGMGAP
jgi:hypothetical protein